MNKHKGRLLLAGLAIAAFVWATSGASEAASRTVTLTVEKVQKMIVDTINSMVPGMIEDAIDARVEELSQAPAGGEEVYPVTNPTILNPIAGDINVRDYGAKGDGSTDDTAAINNAVTAANTQGGGTVYVPDGVYMINTNLANYYGINMKSNVNLKLAANATLKSTDSADAGINAVVYIRDIQNVSVTGGKIVGDVDIHTGTTGEYGMGIFIMGAKNVYIADMEISKCWGDGIAVQGTDTEPPTEDLIIERVRCIDNRRNGLWFASVIRGTITDFQSNYTGLTKYAPSGPWAGICFEPDEIYEDYCQLSDITFNNVTIMGNRGNGVDFSIRNIVDKAPLIGINFVNHRIYGNAGMTGTYGGKTDQLGDGGNCGFTAHNDSLCDISFSNGLSADTATNIITNGNFVNTSGWAGGGCTLSAAGNVLSLTAPGSAATINAQKSTSETVASGDKLFIRAYLKTPTSAFTQTRIRLKVAGSDHVVLTYTKSPIANEWYCISGVTELAASGTGTLILDFFGTITAETVCQVKEVQVINLTAKYGAGNEPNAADCLELFPTWS